MEKLDKKFHGVIFKAKDHSKVMDDEYVVFLAKDNAFAAILPSYLEKCITLKADPVQVQMVKDMIARVDAWRAKHPDRCKVPDAAGERTLG